MDNFLGKKSLQLKHKYIHESKTKYQVLYMSYSESSPTKKNGAYSPRFLVCKSPTSPPTPRMCLHKDPTSSTWPITGNKRPGNTSRMFISPPTPLGQGMQGQRWGCWQGIKSAIYRPSLFPILYHSIPRLECMHQGHMKWEGQEKENGHALKGLFYVQVLPPCEERSCSMFILN